MVEHQLQLPGSWWQFSSDKKEAYSSKNYFLVQNFKGEIMIYVSGIKGPNGHNVFNSFIENAEVFYKWVFLEQF